MPKTTTKFSRKCKALVLKLVRVYTNYTKIMPKEDFIDRSKTTSTTNEYKWKRDNS